MKISQKTLSLFPQDAMILIAKTDKLTSIDDENILYVGQIKDYDKGKDYPIDTFIRIRHVNYPQFETFLKDDEDEIIPNKPPISIDYDKENQDVINCGGHTASEVLAYLEKETKGVENYESK